MLDVGWQRHRAMLLEDGVHVGGEGDSVQIALTSLHCHADAVSHQKLGAGGRRMARADERKRLARGLRALDEDLDLAAGALLPRQPRLDDARVVQDQGVARTHELGEILERQVAQGAARIEVQQAAGGAYRGRMLGDELGRQVVIELGDEHLRQL